MGWNHMGWNIALIENHVKVSKKCAKQLFKISSETQDEHWYSENDVTDSDGLLVFNPDNMEHMDYLWQANYNKILMDNKVKGSILFGSLEGDNFGEFWGYDFDGKGGMKLLKGKLNWKEL